MGKALFGLVCFLLGLTVFGQTQTPLEVLGNRREGEGSSENLKKNPTGFQKEILIDKTRPLALPELLEKEAGIRVRQFGGLGSYSAISIRGANPNQTRVYWNGIPVQNSQNGEVNLADLPLDGIDKIEIFKSSTPAGFSGSSIGGAINLISAFKGKYPISRITLGGGSFGTAKTTMSHSAPLAKGGFTVVGLLEKSDQNYTYLNNQGTVVINTIDDTLDKRKNAQYEKAGFTTNVHWEIGKTTLQFLNDSLYRFQGLPGPGFRQTQSVERKFTKTFQAFATDTKEFLVPWLRLETKWYGTLARDQLFDPRSEFSFGTPNSSADTKQLGVQLQPTIYLLNYAQILRFSLNYEREQFSRSRKTADNRIQSNEPNRKREWATFQVQDEIRLWKESLILSPQVRFESYQDSFGIDNNSPFLLNIDPTQNLTKVNRFFTNPSFGAKWIVWRSGSEEGGFKSNISREFRVPTFLELFGERGTILGNTSLRTENSFNRDFGGYLKKELIKQVFWDSEISFFSKNIRDLILFVPNSQFSIRPENIDSAKITGIESAQSITYNKNWRMVWNQTYQDARNVSNTTFLEGKVLPWRPRNQSSFQINYLQSWGELGLEYNFIGANFRDRTNELTGFLPAREIYNAFWLWKVYNNEDSSKQFHLHFEIRNITDKRVEDFIGFPLPGRLYLVQGSYRF